MERAAHGRVDGAAAPLVRPVRPDDVPMIDAFVQQLSLASRQRRFHAAIRSLPAQWLERMTRPDVERELALVVTLTLDGQEQCVGEARYVQTPDDPHAREFAIAVADGWQGHGLGRSLLRGLERHAARHGVQRLYGDVLRDNLPMIELARSLDYSVCRHPGEARLVRVQRLLRMDTAPHMAPAAALAGLAAQRPCADFI